MTTTEFKQKYPQYSHLEGDELWNKMEEYVWENGEQYITDPGRKIFYHEPIIINGIPIEIEDESKTVWINSKGEKVLLKPEELKISAERSYEPYSMVIWDTTDKKECPKTNPYEGLKLEEKFEKFQKEQENIRSWEGSDMQEGT